jgi:hypothetical protein
VKSESTNGCLVAVVMVLVVLPLSLLLYAWAAALNWNWFAVPLGAPHVSLWQAYGLSLVASSFTGSYVESKDEPGGDAGVLLVKTLLYVVGRFATLVVIGYAVHAWLIGVPS